MAPRPTASSPLTTLLLPRLSGWVTQLTEGARYPAVEKVLARADPGPPIAGQFDPLRLKLFGSGTAGDNASEAPVAALALLAAGTIPATDCAYHLRLDPVSMQADISRVMLMRSGFGGFTADYRQQVHDIIRQVLADEGLQLQAAAGGAIGSGADFWTITLPQHPAVTFTSLDDALGADISDCQPQGEDGRRWKRLANDIQMALHASPANAQCRQRGEPVVNGVWFWGGGHLPEPAESCPFDRVYSGDPVSAGLARLNAIPVASLQEWIDAVQGDTGAWEKLAGNSILVDWAIPASSAAAAELMLTPDRLEIFCATALRALNQSGGVLELCSPEFSLRLTPAGLRRFWRRPRALLQQLRSMLPSVQEEP